MTIDTKIPVKITQKKKAKDKAKEIKTYMLQRKRVIFTRAPKNYLLPMVRHQEEEEEECSIALQAVPPRRRLQA